MAYIFRGTNRDVSEPAPAPKTARKNAAENDPTKCGTMAGYRQHRKFVTPPCQPCKDACAAYHREYQERSRRGETGAKFVADKCGTLTGYHRHMRHRVPVCDACRITRNKWKRDAYNQWKLAA